MNIKEKLAVTDSKAATRAEDAARYADLARKAAIKARDAGKPAIATKLDDEATELERMASTWTQDSLDDEGENQSSEKADSTSEKDQNKLSKESQKSDGDGPEDKPDDGKGGTEESEEDKGLEGDPGMPEKDGDDEKPDNKDGKSQKEPANQKQANDNENTGGQNNTSSTEENDNKDPNQDKNEEPDSKSDQKGGKSKQDNQSSKKDNDKSDTEKDNSDEDDDPIKDIFELQKNQQSMGQDGQMPQKEPRDPTIDEIKKMLAGLKGEAKRGAIDGINDLIKNRPAALDKVTNESLNNLQEGIFTGKNLRDMDDDEWANGLNSILELANSIDPVKIIGSEEKKQSLNNIKQITRDNKVRKELEKELNADLLKDFQKRKALERESQKYTNYRTLEDFKINFYNAIKDQVEQVRTQYQSYDEINAEYEDEGIIAKADVEKLLPDEAVPIINIYFDRSASWGDDYSTNIGKQIVATIKEFEDQGEIKINLLYFSDIVTPDENDPRLNHGTGAWLEILQNIKETEANNVVLMTDKDMEWSAANSPRCRVNGCVWFVWRLDHKGNSGPKYIPEKLYGAGYTGEYAFYRW